LSHDGSVPLAISSGTWRWTVKAVPTNDDEDCSVFLGFSTEMPVPSVEFNHLPDSYSLYDSSSGQIFSSGKSADRVLKAMLPGESVTFVLDMARGTVSVCVGEDVPTLVWAGIHGPVYPVVGNLHSRKKTIQVQGVEAAGHDGSFLSTSVGSMVAVEAISNAEFSSPMPEIPPLQSRLGTVTLAETVPGIQETLITGFSTTCCSRPLAAVCLSLLDAKHIARSLPAECVAESDKVPILSCRSDGFQWLSIPGSLSKLQRCGKTVCHAPASGAPVDRLPLYTCVSCHGAEEVDKDGYSDSQLCCAACINICHYGHSVKFVKLSDKPALSGEELSRGWPGISDTSAVKDALIAEDVTLVLVNGFPGIAASNDLRSHGQRTREMLG
jgi:hypothetical protein